MRFILGGVGMMKKPLATTSGTAGLAAILAWAWNTNNPDMQMPAEVAAAAAPILGEAIRYATQWLPRPE